MSVRTAVIGVGYLGKFHAEKYAKLDDSELVAVVDANAAAAADIAQRHNVAALSDYRELFGRVDAVSIATPTQSHFSIARDCLQQGLHVLLEKPMTVTLEEADALIDIAAAQRCILQIGHLERFNPAVLALDDILREPLFIESHRLAPFKLRATDVDVILDLMIHDIDIILHLVKSELVDITANGATILSSSTDIANARLTFASGCVANVTASRVSMKSERKMRIFQNNAYISVDFQNRILSEHYKQEAEDENGVPIISSREKMFEQADALQAEIESFLLTINSNGTPKVSGADGRQALHTALQINRIMQQGRRG